MTPSTALIKLSEAEDEATDANRALADAHAQFGRAISGARKVSRRAFAKKLGITGAMLALMESGERRWPIKRAELAVKLLTRREDWPD